MTAKVDTFSLPIYPSYCHRSSPTFGRWCPLRSRDVHDLRQERGFEGQDIYFHLNHPIKWVRLTGVIVAIDEFPGRVVFTIDDSSGTSIEATCAAPQKPPSLELPDENANTKAIQSVLESMDFVSPDGPILSDIDVGSIVKIRGKIRAFRDQRQIQLMGPKGVTLLRDTNEEMMCWNDVMTFRTDVLAQPWLVSEEEVRRHRAEQDQEAIWRKEAEEESRRRQRRKQIKEKGMEMTKKKRRGYGAASSGSVANPMADARCGSRDQSHRRKDKGLDPKNRVNQPPRAIRKRETPRNRIRLSVA